jgi:fatty-acyl-CoA synthase
MVDGAVATPDSLKSHVRENLANYKVPRTIRVLEGLPRGSTGKILRRDLQDLIEKNGDDAQTS